MLFIAQQLQLVLVFSEQSLESQVLANDRQKLTQQISLPQTLKTNQKIGFLINNLNISFAWGTYANMSNIKSHYMMIYCINLNRPLFHLN